MNFAAYSTGFLFATFKFMLAASFMMPFEVTYWEVVFATFFGAFFGFCLFYFSSGFFMEKAKQKKLEKIKNGTLKPKNQFTKLNKFVVKLKLSPYGYIGLLICGPMFMSIPIGSIVLAKFYRRLKFTFWAETVILFLWANLFSALNLFIFK